MSSGTSIFTSGRYLCTFCSTIVWTKTQLSRSNLRWPPLTTPNMLSRSVSCNFSTRPRIFVEKLYLDLVSESAIGLDQMRRARVVSRKGLPPRIFLKRALKIDLATAQTAAFRYRRETCRNSRRTSLCTLARPVLSFIAKNPRKATASSGATTPWFI